MIKAVFFDLDNTLYDFEQCMRNGLAVALQYMFDRRPVTRGLLSVEKLVRMRDDLDAEADELGFDLKEMRVESFRRALKLCGCEEELAREIGDVYFANRFTRAQPYDGALKALKAFKGRYVLGLLSNGNTDPKEVGLEDWFDHKLFSEEVGAAKPEARFFEMALERVPCRADEMVYVGDVPRLDVGGAKGVGIHAVWFNPHDRPYPDDIPRPDHEIADLAEMIGIVEGLDAQLAPDK